MRHRTGNDIFLEISWQRKLASFAVSLIFLIKKFIKRPLPKDVKNILVIHWGYLGDMILVTPALQLLRRCYPAASIKLVTNPENADYVGNCPYVNEVMYIKNPFHIGRRRFSFNGLVKAMAQLRNARYDIALEFMGRLTDQVFLPFLKARYAIGQDLTNNFYYLDRQVHSSRKPQIERNSDVVKALCAGQRSFQEDEQLWSPVEDEDRKKVALLLQSSGITHKYVIVHSTASWKPKIWPADRWVELIRYLLNEKISVIFVGSITEYYAIEKIREFLGKGNHYNFTGRISIREVIALMEKAELFIGNDSGPMHLAAVSGVKSIILFGSSDPVRWGHRKHVIIYKNPPCGPCAPLAFTESCSKGMSTCRGLLEITALEVIERCKNILQTEGGKS